MDKLIFGLTVTLVGILIVFFGLVVLMTLITVMGALTKERKKTPKTKAQEVSAPTPVAAPAPVVQTPAAQDDALIAVISAAVAMMMDEGSQFTVRRIRRINNAPAWGRSGREEQVYSRF